MKMPSSPCKLPLIARHGAKMEYFRLDEHGKLQHWQFNENEWVISADNLFQQYLCGFDGAVDERGALHLLGYNGQGSLYYLPASVEPAPPQLIYADPQREICQISCCVDPLGLIHILYLAATAAGKGQQLYYLHGKEKEWQMPSCVDTVFFGGKGSSCCILSDRANLIYLIYPVMDEDRARLALRKMNMSSNHAGRIYLFPGKQDGPCWPSYYCDGQNNIHIAWINRQADSVCLNYIQREKTGDWRCFFQTALPAETLSPALLSCDGSDLRIAFRWGEKTGLFYSRNGGIHWNRGKDMELEPGSTLTRMRVGYEDKGSPAAAQNIVYCFTVPPHKLQKTAINGNIVQAGQSDGELSNYILAILSSYAFTRAREMDEENKLLIGELEQKIAEKTLQLDEAASIFNVTLQKHREQLEREKGILREQVNLLRADLLKLQTKNEKLLRQSTVLEQKIAILEGQEKNRSAAPPQQINNNLFRRFLLKLKSGGHQSML